VPRAVCEYAGHRFRRFEDAEAIRSRHIQNPTDPRGKEPFNIVAVRLHTVSLAGDPDGT